MSVVNELLSQPVGELDTRPPLVPEGVYHAKIEKVTVDLVPGKDGAQLHVLNLECRLDDPNRVLRFRCFLDVDEKGRLKTGKGDNWRLGQVRKALGLASGSTLLDMQGLPCRVMVTHREFEDSTGERRTVDEVRRILPVEE